MALEAWKKSIGDDPAGRVDEPEATTGRGPVNQLIQGSALVTLLGVTLTIGFLGHLVSTESSYKSLEGPFVGDRVGIYQSANADGPWLPTAQTSKFDHANCANVLPELTVDHSEKPYRLLLYCARFLNSLVDLLLKPKMKPPFDLFRERFDETSKHSSVSSKRRTRNEQR